MGNETKLQSYTCVNCGKRFQGEVSCPHCGHEFQINKKSKAALVVVGIIIALAVIALIFSIFYTTRQKFIIKPRLSPAIAMVTGYLTF